MITMFKTSKKIEDLGNGLILRRATPDDVDELAVFNSKIHSDYGPEQPDIPVEAWTRDLMEGNHPTFRVDDFTIVEDKRKKKIVSSTNLISQTWTYGGIPIKVGRPELVGTDPDYRNRGLVRKQFELIHRWSAERGEKLQGITGIPYYYRQFGYEMAGDLGGSRSGYRRQVPFLEADQTDPYRVRPATEADAGFISRLYNQGNQRYLLSCVRDEAHWRYEIGGRRENNVNRTVLDIIETSGGEPIGFLGLSPNLWRETFMVKAYELCPGQSWWHVTPSVVRYVWEKGSEYAARDHTELQVFVFGLGRDHPVYAAFAEGLPRSRRPYAWYLRVPNLPDFLQTIAPVLEQRLSQSVCSGFSGELNLSFYREGVKLSFQAGRLSGVEPWKVISPSPTHAGFPGLSFLQILFGYRSLDDLMYAFPDCWVSEERNQVLIRSLFPVQGSDIMPVD